MDLPPAEALGRDVADEPEVRRANPGAQPSEGEVRVEVLLFPDFAEGGEGLRDGVLKGDESGDRALKTQPDYSGALEVGKAAQAADLEREGFETSAGELKLLDSRGGFVGCDVAKESECEMDLVRFGPTDMLSAGARAERSLDFGKSGRQARPR